MHLNSVRECVRLAPQVTLLRCGPAVEAEPSALLERLFVSLRDRPLLYVFLETYDLARQRHFLESDLGLPVIEEALAELECTVVHVYPGGDHTIFVAQVETAEARGHLGKEPLLYFRGKYSRLHPHQ